MKFAKEENLIVHFIATHPGTQDPDEPVFLYDHFFGIKESLDVVRQAMAYDLPGVRRQEKWDRGRG